MKNIFHAVLLLAAFSVLSACEGWRDYRTQGDCKETIRLGPENDETRLLAEQAGCPIQIHETAHPYVHPVGAMDTPKYPQTHRLAFLEFGNGKGNSNQIRAVEGLLAEPGQKYLVAFVHGWRHNSGVGDTDVRKFRVMLAYARSFLNTRCTENRRYCNAQLIGLYFGWRGASLKEPDEGSAIWTLPALPTFGGRKSESESLAHSVIATLRDKVAARLHLHQGDPQADKLLVVGHSFGANMLATGLEAPVVDAVLSHEKGAVMKPPLGDLTVLINPASEARKWTAIQAAVAARAGHSILADKWPNPDFERLFPIDQPPGYVALTSACDWSEAERTGSYGKDRPIRCDRATEFAFPIGATLFEGQGDRESRTTIGHLNPTYDLRKAARQLAAKDYRQVPPIVGSRLVGTTHEFIINNVLFDATTFINTSYEHAVDPKYSRCDVADGWLLTARQKALGSGSGWDSAYSDGKQDINLRVSAQTGVLAQFRQALSLPGSGSAQLRSVAPLNSPFWNTRAFDTAVEDHGVYVSYPIWCSINQLILDNPVARK